MQAPLAPHALSDAQVERILSSLGAALAQAGAAAAGGAPGGAGAGRGTRQAAASAACAWVPSETARRLATLLAQQQLELLRLRDKVEELQAANARLAAALPAKGDTVPSRCRRPREAEHSDAESISPRLTKNPKR